MNKIFFGNLLKGTLLFERYRIVRCLGANDFTGVYLCTDEKRQAHIVLKVTSTLAEKEGLPRPGFLEEWRKAYDIKHPNVVAAEEFYRDEDFTAFTMEYVEGGNLAELTERGRLSITQALDALRQIASGLKAIHSQNIVHRDLKPENILLTKQGRPKIADFGISVNLKAEHIEREITGTMNYLSPEYVKDGNFDVRTDIYALGIIAYQLVTGRLPFQGGSLLETLRLRVRFDPLPPSLLRRDCPAALSNIILKAMARDIERRYQSVSEFIHDLETLAMLGIDTPALEAVLPNFDLVPVH